MKTIDTNVILRYLLNDVPEQSEIAAQVIMQGAKSYPEIIAEVIYVLVKLYSVPREKIAELLMPFIDEIEFDIPAIIKFAVNMYSQTKFDFVDCLLVARKIVLGDTIFSFDKKLMNKLK